MLDGDRSEPRVVAVSRDAGHGFSKPSVEVVRLLAGLGVEGDAHLGETVQHRSRVRRDVLALGEGTRLHLGPQAQVRITGLRNPCHQIDDHAAGLLRHVFRRGEDGAVERRAGVMGVVEVGGEVRPGDRVRVVAPNGAHRPLGPV